VENEQTDALVAIDKLDKIGVEGVKRELQGRAISINSADKILNFFSDLNLRDNSTTLQGLTDFVGRETESLKDLRQILAIASNAHLKIDASLARGLSYYTGAIFEISVPDLAGSLGGGGRYDGLIGMFGKEQIPACGFSLGLERILVVMDERGMFPPEIKTDSVDVMVTIWNKESAHESLKLANELRARDLRVLVYPEADKLSKQFKYASSINIPFVCILGENELAENKVALKNMATGEQEIVGRDDVAGRIRK
jgi:histidyl-tRNA synthetase